MYSITVGQTISQDTIDQIMGLPDLEHIIVVERAIDFPGNENYKFFAQWPVYTSEQLKVQGDDWHKMQILEDTAQKYKYRILLNNRFVDIRNPRVQAFWVNPQTHQTEAVGSALPAKMQINPDPNVRKVLPKIYYFPGRVEHMQGTNPPPSTWFPFIEWEVKRRATPLPPEKDVSPPEPAAQTANDYLLPILGIMGIATIALFFLPAAPTPTLPQQ